MTSTAAMVNELKSQESDFEWYPTTVGMINLINQYLMNHRKPSRSDFNVLDCGAGDGRVLKALSNGGEMYAVEKAIPLIKAMDKHIVIVGTEFDGCTLVDKEVDVVFSNPPYSSYEAWATKIIKEANSTYVFLILPERWRDSARISYAMQQRKASESSLGFSDFINAERKARAKVEIIAIKLQESRYDRGPTVDPFDLWFDETFSPQADKTETSSYHTRQKEKEDLKERVDKVALNRGVVIPMVEMYLDEMELLKKNFVAVCQLDKGVFQELAIDVKSLKTALKQRIVGLKNKYWNEIFNRLEPVTTRLTVSSRKSMLEKLHRSTNIDFTATNIYALTIWVIKNANSYYDRQLVETAEAMVTQSNILMYKSNQRTWRNDEWRYCRSPEGLRDFSLELRIVLSNQGGIKKSWISDRYEPKLEDRSEDFVSDLVTIANNLGYPTQRGVSGRQWYSGEKQVFMTIDGKTLMEVKAFQNGNLHIKFNQSFIRKLNVEFGRLKGWIKSKEQAAEEMNIPVEEVEFNSNFQFNPSNQLLLN